MTNSLLEAFDIRNRVAIVTGGSLGIGRAIATGFASLGAHVVIASRKVDACEDAVRAIKAQGGSALAIPTHVGRLEDLAALVDRSVSTFGGIDIVVNNAANPLSQPLGKMSAEAFAKSYETNVRGPLFLIQEALKYLRASEHASVINVISAGVFTHGASVSLYVSAKSALLSLTRSMAAEFARDGVRVNALAPGTTETRMVLTLPQERQEGSVRAQLIRRMAQPDELVPGALFLASDASSFMTGQVLILDGGMTVH